MIKNQKLLLGSLFGKGKSFVEVLGGFEISKAKTLIQFGRRIGAEETSFEGCLHVHIYCVIVRSALMLGIVLFSCGFGWCLAQPTVFETSLPVQNDHVATTTALFTVLVTAAPNRRRLAEDAKNVTFKVEPSAGYPHTILQISYDNSSDVLALYGPFKVNFTDLSASLDLASFPPLSYDMTSNPLQIHGLQPGHEYRFEIFGLSQGIPTLLATLTQMTDPKAPDVNDSDLRVTTNSISFTANKASGFLDDFILVQWTQLEPFIRDYLPLNLTFAQDHTALSVNIPNLVAGTPYNVTMIAVRSDRASKPWQRIVVTNPLPPTNFKVVESSTDSIVVSWDASVNTSFDSFIVNVSGSIEKSEVLNRQSRTFRLTALKPGTDYRLTVETTKNGTHSDASPALTAVTAPLSPQNISFMPNYATSMYDTVVMLPPTESSSFDACQVHYSAGNGPQLNANVSVTPNSGLCRFDLLLDPGTTYQFAAWMSSHGVLSAPYRQNVTVLPALDLARFEVNFTQTYDQIQISWPPLPFWSRLVGLYGNLTALLSETGTQKPSTVQVRSEPGNLGGTLAFDGLSAGACYELSLTTTVGDVRSANVSRSSLLTKLPLMSFNMRQELTADSANLGRQILQPPQIANGGGLLLASNCVVDIVVRDDDGEVVTKQLLEANRVNITFQQLQPYTKYHVTGVITCASKVTDTGCPPVTADLQAYTFYTLQAKPDAPRNVSVAATLPYAGTVTWLQPLHTNGPIQEYLVTLIPSTTASTKQMYNESAWNISVPYKGEQELAVFVHNFTAGMRYKVLVRGRTDAGYGDAGVFFVDMQVDKPPQPNGAPEVTLSSVAEHSFAAAFNMSLLNTRNGLLTEYAIIVAEGIEEQTFDVDDRMNWTVVQKYVNWPPYIAIRRALTPLTKIYDKAEMLNFVVGDEDCKLPASASSMVYCNGPLQPGTKYRVKLRVYTSSSLYSDSYYSSIIETADVSSKVTPGVVAALVLCLGVPLLVLLTVGAICARQRGFKPINWWKSKGTNQTDGYAGNHLYQRRSVNSPPFHLDKIHHLEPLHTLLPADHSKSRPVRKKDFAEHVRLMSADSDFRFSEEFEDLKQVGRTQSCSAADFPCNRAKNRFTNILPYDHSRVKLSPVDDEEGSDYINANYMPGFNSPREFIAAQGPLPSTRDDFWRMTWEQGTTAIVNLTRCVEKGREKCDRYWPLDMEPVYYGDIEVKVMNEVRYPNWTVSELRVTKGDAFRTIRHYHYSSWPDFGVPERPQSLIKFVRLVRLKTPADGAMPIIVHCSAGVGRSGTFVALDRLLHHIQRHDTVDVFGIVYEMRKERVWMVQTEQQYICIHQAVVCVLEGREDDLHSALPSGSVGNSAEVHQNPVFEDDEGIEESGF